MWVTTQVSPPSPPSPFPPQFQQHREEPCQGGPTKSAPGKDRKGAPGEGLQPWEFAGGLKAWRGNVRFPASLLVSCWLEGRDWG